MTRRSSYHSQNNSRPPAKVIWALITGIGVIVGIIADSVNIFDRFKKPFQTSESNTQTILQTTTQKADLAISKAKAAREKSELKIARNKLQEAIQELEKIPKNQGIDNQIQTKKTEYENIAEQIDRALAKQPCYEKAWNCQEYPIKLMDNG